LPIYRLSALALKGADRSVCIDGADGSSILLDCGPLQTDLPQFWRAVLHSFNTNPYSPGGSVHYCQPTTKHHRAFDAALGVLAERLPATHAALMRWIQRVVVVQGEAGEDGVAGSSPRFLGCILVPAKYFERPAAALAGELVHEMAHQELFVLNAFDRLVQPSADNVMRYSIFAGVRRPTIGRLHAAHAIFRMIQVARATEQGSRLLRGQLRLTTRTFRSDDLTPFAQRVVRDVYKMAR
jgi:HEXXH motif-containing protein